MGQTRMSVSIEIVGTLALRHTPWTDGLPFPPGVKVVAVSETRDFGRVYPHTAELVIEGDAVPDAESCSMVIHRGEDGVERFQEFTPRRR